MSSEDSVGHFFWLDGELLASSDASVSVLDHGLTVGDGAFETIAVLDGRPFAPSRHLARLRRTLAGLRLHCETTDAQLRAAIAAVIEANGERCERVRLTVTGGRAALGSERTSTESTVLIGSTRAVQRAGTTAVITVPWTRNERSAVAGLKTISYAENVVALTYAQERGGSEALLANTRGELCEGTGSNIFVVVDGELITPPLSSGCLAGVTRELVLELMPVTERSLPMTELGMVTEAFLTSSTRDVQPIMRIDKLGLPPPGPWTRKTQEAFGNLKRTKADP